MILILASAVMLGVAGCWIWVGRELDKLLDELENV